MDTQNTTEMEDLPLTKIKNKHLVFNAYNSNTDRPTNSTVDNNTSLS